MQSTTEINQFDTTLWHLKSLTCDDGSIHQVPVPNDIEWMMFVILQKAQELVNKRWPLILLVSLLLDMQAEQEICWRQLLLGNLQRRYLRQVRDEMVRDVNIIRSDQVAQYTRQFVSNYISNAEQVAMSFSGARFESDVAGDDDDN